MVVLIAGASHTGKTKLAQVLLEKYKFPYLSIDHLKMGFIRSGNTELTLLSMNPELTDFLWSIVREIVKTVIENKQNLIVEGCYIPFDWKKDFDEHYLSEIKYVCLVMSENYIKTHFKSIRDYASVIEHRLDDSDCKIESILEDNIYNLKMCRKYQVDYLLIDSEYNVDLELKLSFKKC